MDTSLKLYYVANDGTTRSFPEGNYEQAEVYDFTVNKTRMGNAPTITATLEYPYCLDEEWDAFCHFDDVYVVFNNERYYLKATPSSSKSNEKSFYKHELSFVSERSVLETVYMLDDNENQTANILYSNNTQYTFFGSIQNFAERINQSMYFSDIGDTCMYVWVTDHYEIVQIADRVLNGDGYYVVVDASVTNTDEVLITLSNNTVNDALKQVFEKFGVPYYFVGKVIHFGEYEAVTETIPTFAVGGVLGASIESGSLVPYEYGQPNAVLNVSRNNGTKQIYNRCSGTGSEDNIPYYYPNPTPSGTIHHKTTAQSGSTLTDNDVTVDNYLKFSDLGLNDALVYVHEANALTEYIGKKMFYFDGHLVIFANGIPLNQRITYNFKSVSYNPQTGSYSYAFLPLTITIMVKLTLTKPYEELHFDFSTEFPDGTNWSFFNDEGGVYMTGNGNLFDYTGEALLEGTYYISFEKTYTNSHTGNLTIQQINQYKDANVSISDLVSDSRRWEGLYGYQSKYWKLQSNGNMVLLDRYGLSVDDGVDLVSGDKIEKVVDKWVMPQTKLMPSCYRLSDGTKRFYPALNYPFSATGYTPDADLGEEVVSGNVENDNYKDENSQYYGFDNPYRRLKQREHIYDFPDIKPTIKGIINTDGERIDMFRGIAFDTNDDNSGYFDENGNFNYNHPYFFVQLDKMGFNLFDHAIDEAEMIISMTSGDCAPCEFTIMVDKETKKNLVQYDGGYLRRDEDGDVICGRKNEPISPIPAMNDTTNNNVWVALKKDVTTFGESNIMPFNDGSVTIRPKAKTNIQTNDGDTFVILHIEMPTLYVTAAEEELTRQIIKSMNDDNSESFNISLKYSRVFLGDNQGLIDLLNENVKVSARYNNTTKEFFVSSYSYAMKSSSPIPEITINGLVETVEELKASAASGGFVSHLANQISENFEELMMGTGKPLTRIIQQNNTTVTNQIKGDFPTDYVRTKSELFADYIVMGAGDKQVKTLPKGLEGQVLMMLNGLPTWGNVKESVINSVTKQLSSSFAILSTTSTISALTNTVEEDGKYLIVAQLQVETSSEGTSRSGFVIAQIINSTPKPTVLLGSGKAYISLSGQVIVCAVADLEKEDVIHIDIEANSSSLYNVVPSTTNGNSTYTKCSSVQYIRIL